MLCPSLHIVFLRIARTICSLLSTYEDSTSSGKALEIAQCLLLGQCRVTLRPLLLSPGYSTIEEECLPYAPVLYREALLDLTFFSLQRACENAFSSSQTSDEGDCGGPFSTYPVALLLPLLSHPVSEVREGVLLGCIKALSLGASDLSSPDSMKQYLLHSTCLLEDLLSRAAGEMEPPLRNLTLQLMCR